MPRSKFETEVEIAFAELEDEFMDIVSAAMQRGLRYLENNSPVWSGWYQRNHRVSINNKSVELDPSEKANDDNDKFGRGELAVNGIPHRERAKLNRAELGDIIYIGNAVPYSQVLEEQGTPRNPAGGWYQKAAIVIAERIRNRGD